MVLNVTPQGACIKEMRQQGLSTELAPSPQGCDQHILTRLFNYRVLAGTSLCPVSTPTLPQERFTLLRRASALSAVCHSGVLAVPWDLSKFCLISQGSWAMRRTRARLVHPEQQSPIYLLSLYYISLSQSFQVLQKHLQTASEV